MCSRIPKCIYKVARKNEYDNPCFTGIVYVLEHVLEHIKLKVIRNEMILCSAGRCFKSYSIEYRSRFDM